SAAMMPPTIFCVVVGLGLLDAGVRGWSRVIKPAATKCLRTRFSQGGRSAAWSRRFSRTRGQYAAIALPGVERAAVNVALVFNSVSLKNVITTAALR
ncbi:MAG: hypothetical protein J2P48_15520, partial [Alphaproteobacteria bacterium]|nr:hypothetical protein [Alphaproteobacteria bacterium]